MNRPFTLLVLGALFSGVSLAQSSALPSQRLAEDASRALGLERSEVGSLRLLAVTGERVGVSVDLPGSPLVLDLKRQSVRAEDFEVRAQIHDGSWVVLESEPVRTFRGTVYGEPDSQVAASWLDDGLHARIRHTDGSETWLEPIVDKVVGASATSHVAYRTEDILAGGGLCDADLLGGSVSAPASGMTLGQRPADPDMPGDVHAAANNTAELACDADYEYFQDWGSTGAVQNRIESIINTVNLQYESDVDITHAITTILIRTSSNDPYTKKPADQLLFEFRAEWLNNQGSVQRDVAHLFTGRGLAGSTIGIAWVGAVCNEDVGYSLVESDFDNNFGCVTDLSAHELGHNWGANHCSCTSYTMNAFITCANQFNPSVTIPAIEAYRDSQSCFGGVDPPDPPTDPVSIHVASITPATVNAGQGNKRGRATVSIVTDTGVPVSGASVSGTFTGDYNESFSGTTNSSGSVTFTTAGTKKGGISFTFCVDNVSGSLPYVSADNAETCDSF